MVAKSHAGQRVGLYNKRLDQRQIRPALPNRLDGAERFDGLEENGDEAGSLPGLEDLGPILQWNVRLEFREVDLAGLRREWLEPW